MLAASEQIETEQLDNSFMVGELALTGAVRPVKGVLPIALRARAEGKAGVLVPAENAAEAAVVAGLQVIPVQNLREAVELSRRRNARSRRRKWMSPRSSSNDHDDELDFAEVKGQESVKRALEIAAAGGHNVLLIGPPAPANRCSPNGLPPFCRRSRWKKRWRRPRSTASSACSQPGQALVTRRPFRAPHHTASDAGCWAATSTRRPAKSPWRITACLFLDELPEFKRSVLETMRQPLEEGRVTISRAAGTHDLSFRSSCWWPR